MGQAPEQYLDHGTIAIGVDEAGRGPLAGPVVAGAVVLCKHPPRGLTDSKALTAKRRGVLDAAIRESCVWAVGIADIDAIEARNILGAAMWAMTQAVARVIALLPRLPDDIRIDGNLSPCTRCPEWDAQWGRGAPVVGGDAIDPAISAASIVAKEWRDRIMTKAASRYPAFGWDTNKGYGTKAHLDALRRHGPTPLHRRTFAPVAQLTML